MIRLSTGARNMLAQGAGFASIFNHGTIEIYNGTQPVTADSASTGRVLLGIVSNASGAVTKETRATGSITITGGSVSVATLTVGGFNIIPDGAVPYNTSTTQTASDLCDAINRNGVMQASVTGAVVTITPMPGAGAAYNGLVVTSTGSVVATYANMASGASPANGLILGQPATGVVGKSAGQVWSFNGIAVGTAGWFRFVASAADAGAAISAAPYLARMDGSVATSGADLNLSNISIAIGAPSTVDSFNVTVPAQ